MKKGRVKVTKTEEEEIAQIERKKILKFLGDSKNTKQESARLQKTKGNEVISYDCKTVRYMKLECLFLKRKKHKKINQVIFVGSR